MLFVFSLLNLDFLVVDVPHRAINNVLLYNEFDKECQWPAKTTYLCFGSILPLVQLHYLPTSILLLGYRKSAIRIWARLESFCELLSSKPTARSYYSVLIGKWETLKMW